MSTQTKPEQDKATARPWAVVGGYGPSYTSINSPDGYIVWQMADCKSHKEHGSLITAPGYETQRANAALIVRAVNEYDALKDLEETIKLVVGEGIIDSYLIEQKLATLAALRKEQS